MTDRGVGTGDTSAWPPVAVDGDVEVVRDGYHLLDLVVCLRPTRSRPPLCEFLLYFSARLSMKYDSHFSLASVASYPLLSNLGLGMYRPVFTSEKETL